MILTSTLIYADTNNKKMYIQFNKKLPENRFFKIYIKQKLIDDFDECQLFVNQENENYLVTNRFGNSVYGSKLKRKIYTSVFVTKKQTIII